MHNYFHFNGRKCVQLYGIPFVQVTHMLYIYRHFQFNWHYLIPACGGGWGRGGNGKVTHQTPFGKPAIPVLALSMHSALITLTFQLNSCMGLFWEHNIISYRELPRSLQGIINWTATEVLRDSSCSAACHMPKKQGNVTVCTIAGSEVHGPWPHAGIGGITMACARVYDHKCSLYESI